MQKRSHYRRDIDTRAAKVLLMLMARDGKNVQELADALELPRSAVSKLLLGQRRIYFAEAVVLAELFHVDLDVLRTGRLELVVTGGSSSAWTPNTAGQPHLFLVETCEACGENLGHERSFGRMHSRCVERLIHAA